MKCEIGHAEALGYSVLATGNHLITGIFEIFIGLGLISIAALIITLSYSALTSLLKTDKKPAKTLTMISLLVLEKISYLSVGFTSIWMVWSITVSLFRIDTVYKSGLYYSIFYHIISFLAYFLIKTKKKQFEHAENKVILLPRKV